MSHIIAPTSVTVQPDPRDRGSSYTWAWVAWIAAFAILEAKALHDDARSPDRVKRTLSSNLRWWFATDSVTGIPVDARHGKARRFVLFTGLGWFNRHIERTEWL